METDNRILAAARSMKREAIIEIFDLYAPALYRYVLRLCNDAVLADQIVGDVFAKLLEHLSAGRGPDANLRSYLFETAYHCYVDEVRYCNRWAPIEDVDLNTSHGHSTQMRAEHRELVEFVQRTIMSKLTEDQRHVIILRFLEGLSVEETSLIIGKKVNNVKVIQSRAIAALRLSLEVQVVETGDITFMNRIVVST